MLGRRVSRDGRNYWAADAAKSVLAPSALVGDNRGGCLETDARLRRRPNSCRSASQGANEPGSCDVRPSRRRRDGAAWNDERRRRLDVLEIDLRCRARAPSAPSILSISQTQLLRRRAPNLVVEYATRQIKNARLSKGQIPLLCLVADGFEAGRRPAASRNLAYHLARASRSATSFESVCDQIA